MLITTVLPTQSSVEAKSRLIDTDFAQEISNLTKYQILQQAGIAMPVQLNGPSLIVQRNLNFSNATLANSIERLSEGLRPLSAEHERAGAALSQRALEWMLSSQTIVTADIELVNERTRTINNLIHTYSTGF